MSTPRPTRLPPLLAVLTLALALAPAAPAQQVGGAIGGALVTQREAAKTAVANYKLHGSLSLDQLVQVDARDGTLNVTVNADLPSQTEALRVDVPGSDATWVVRKRTLGAGATTYVTLSRYDFDAPEDQPWLTTLTLRSNYVSMSAQAGENGNPFRVRLTQANGNLTFTGGRGVGPANAQFSFTAPSLAQLHAEHPAEVRRHLVPLLHALTGRTLLRPGATDVYRAFPEIPADPAAARKLDHVLARLDADAYADRDRADRDLHALGPAGVLALLRRDLADLSPEARTRADVFLAARSNTPYPDPARARADGAFLLDCLDDDDPAVRAAAKSDLENLVGRPVDFDTTLTGGPRATAVDTLRRQLQPRFRPTTQPARPATQ
jgi:hypothetical protein